MIIRIILLLVLIFINGILSASEIAYLSLDKFDLERRRNKKAKKILKIIENESIFLSTIQVGITLAGFLASAFASETFTELIMKSGFLIHNEVFTKTLLMILVTLLLSYITLIFGELVPKKIGRSNPYGIALSTISLISFISTIFYPIILLLTKSTEFVCNIFNIKERNDALTEKDIRRMIITGSKEGIVEEKEKEYILNIFEFNDKNASKIMTPRDKVITLNINDTKASIIKTMKKSKYTRFPVLDNNKVIGFVNVKDFIYLHQSKKDVKLKDILHPIMAFNKTDKIDDIFRIMQEKHEAISIIKDKDEFIGILTIEDAVEEIVGNIDNEN